MKFLIVFVSSSIILASATAQNNNRAVSNEETLSFQTKFEATSTEDNVKWNIYKARLSGTGEQKEIVIAWIQPLNKKEPCKIYFNAPLVPGKAQKWDNKDNHYYWDGSCKNGYAFGIGREFEKVDGGLKSALADYKEVNKEPVYYLNTDYDRNFVMFSAKAPPYYTSLTYALRQQQTKNEVHVNVEIVDIEENKAYYQNTAIGADEVHSFMVLPNLNRYITIRSSNPFKSGYVIGTQNAVNEKTGYNIMFLDNGINKQLRHLQYSTATKFEDVLIPSSYLNHLNEVDNKIKEKFNVAGRILEEAYVAINKYRRNICKGNVKVDFVENEIYGRICLENGEISRYSTIIEEANKNMMARYQLATEEIARQKENLFKERQYESAKQDMLTNQAAQVQANRQNSESLNHAVSEFSRSMEDMNRRSSQFTQSLLMNPIQIPQSQFGNTGATRINCVHISNITSCR